LSKKWPKGDQRPEWTGNELLTAHLPQVPYRTSVLAGFPSMKAALFPKPPSTDNHGGLGSHPVFQGRRQSGIFRAGGSPICPGRHWLQLQVGRWQETPVAVAVAFMVPRFRRAFRIRRGKVRPDCDLRFHYFGISGYGWFAVNLRVFLQMD
jgi:hypothetical protein